MTTDLVWIPAQTAALGSDQHYPEEGPVRQVAVEGFWIQPHQVTNADFAHTLGRVLHRPTILPTPLFPLKARFGAELDSLADFVNFGVAPGLILS